MSERRNRTYRDDSWLPDFLAMMQEHSAKQFQWGVHDCATVAAKVVRLRKSVDMPTWKNARKAMKLLNERSLLDRVTDTLGTPMPWGECIIGDVAVAKNDDERMPEVLAVFDGNGFLVPNHRGFARILDCDIIAGWSP